MLRSYCLFLLFFLSASIALAQPANDDCANAMLLPNPVDYCSANAEFTTVFATQSLPAEGYPTCVPNDQENEDVWFSFVAVGTDVNIRVTGQIPNQPQGSLLTPQAVLYSGSCDDLVPESCISSNAGQHSVSVIYGPLVVGDTYYISVGARNGRNGTFQLCVDNFNAAPAPDGDCPTGVVLCDKSPFAVPFLSGQGLIQGEIDGTDCNSSTCSFTETNSAWYKWTCDDPGTLAFSITPNNPNDDIDFVLFELPNGIDDCSGKQDIRCMASGENVGQPFAEWFPCTGATGLSLNDNDNSENCGCQAGNNNFASAINMVAGRSYALVILNFTGSGEGFGIEFGGTGTFLGPTADYTISTQQACVGETVTFNDASSFIGVIEGYEWNFGPTATPSTATGPGPHSVVFNRPGTRAILLEVETDRGCLVRRFRNDLTIVCCDDQFELVTDVTPVQCPSDGTGMIDLTAQSAYNPITYAWNTGEITQDLTGLDVGTFTVTVTNETTCRDSLTVAVPGPPAFAFDTLVTMPTCDGGTDGVLTLQVSGATPGYQFNFDGAGFQDGNTLTGIPQGIYEVVVRDANGCEETLSIPVSELILELDPQVTAIMEPVCFNDANGSIQLNISNGLPPYQYDFNDGNGFQDGDAIDNIPSGSYIVEVLDANRCRGNFVFEVPNPPALQTDLAITDISCFGDNDGRAAVAVAGGRPGYVYSWSTGSADSSVVNLGPGPVSVTITDTNGCPIVADSTITQPPQIFVEVLEVTDNVCFGESNGSVSLLASGGRPGYEYSADGFTFQLDSILGGLPAGPVTLTVMDASGCTDSTTAFIDEPAEFLLAVADQLAINLGFDTVLTVVANYPGVDYTWAPGDSTDCLNFDCSRYRVNPVNTINYTVLGINEAGCPAQATVKVIVIKDRPVYIPNAFTPDGNGANDGFTLFTGPAVTSITSFQIFDRWGGLVFNAPVAIPPNEPRLGWDGTQNGKPVNSGVFVYVFQVEFLDGNTQVYSGDVTVVR